MSDANTNSASDATSREGDGIEPFYDFEDAEVGKYYGRFRKRASVAPAFSAGRGLELDGKSFGGLMSAPPRWMRIGSTPKAHHGPLGCRSPRRPPRARVPMNRRTRGRGTARFGSQVTEASQKGVLVMRDRRLAKVRLSSPPPSFWGLGITPLPWRLSGPRRVRGAGRSCRGLRRPCASWGSRG